jgi:hypothetical protein
MIIHEIMETPEGINGKSIVDSICNILGQDEDTNDNAKHRSKHPKYFKFTALFTRSIDYHPIPAPLTTTPFVSRSPTSLIGTTLITPTYMVNAKYKEISCKPIKPLYDGTTDDLMPFLLRLDIRHQDDTHREDFVPSYCKTDSDKKLLETKDSSWLW